MGRDSGFVAMHAATAADVVDLCMIPEVKVDMKDVIEHVDATLAKKKYMVIAVAEGAGQELVSTGKQDDTGHTVYGDIGVFLKDTLNKHLIPSCIYFEPTAPSSIISVVHSRLILWHDCPQHTCAS